MVGGAAHDDAAPFFRDLADDLVLREHGAAHGVRGKVQPAQYVGGILVDVGDEVSVQPALVRGEGDHLLVVEGDAELFCRHFADLLARRAVLPRDGDDDARLRGLERELARL